MPRLDARAHELPENLRTAILPLMMAFFKAYEYPTDLLETFKQIIPFRMLPDDPKETNVEPIFLVQTIDDVPCLLINTPDVLQSVFDMAGHGGMYLGLPTLLMTYLVVVYLHKLIDDGPKPEPTVICDQYIEFSRKNRKKIKEEEQRLMEFLSTEMFQMTMALREYDFEKKIDQETAKPFAEKPTEGNPEVEFTIAPLNKKPKTQEG